MQTMTLQQIDDAVTKMALGGWNEEELFKLGVTYGRLLASTGATVDQLPFFRKRKTIKEINDLLNTGIRCALFVHSQTQDDECDLTSSWRSEDCDEEYGIRLEWMTFDGYHVCRFECSFIDEIGELLKRYGLVLEGRAEVPDAVCTFSQLIDYLKHWPIDFDLTKIFTLDEEAIEECLVDLQKQTLSLRIRGGGS